MDCAYSSAALPASTQALAFELAQPPSSCLHNHKPMGNAASAAIKAIEADLKKGEELKRQSSAGKCHTVSR